MQSADAAPTVAQQEAFHLSAEPLERLLQQWDAVKKTDVSRLNHELKQKGLPLLVLNTFRLDHDVEDQIEVGDEF